MQSVNKFINRYLISLEKRLVCKAYPNFYEFHTIFQETMFEDLTVNVYLISTQIGNELR